MPLRTGEVFLQMYDTERVEILKVLKGRFRELLAQVVHCIYTLDLLKWEVGKEMAMLKQHGPII